MGSGGKTSQKAQGGERRFARECKDHARLSFDQPELTSDLRKEKPR
jgi:hypothetical protein